MNPVHILTPTFSNIYFNNFFHPHSGLPNCLFCLCFLNIFLYVFLISSMHGMYPEHLILYLITLVIFYEGYKL